MKTIHALFFYFFLIFSSSAYAFNITSPAFENNEEIPKIYSCKNNGGNNISIPIIFSDVPEDAKSLALIIEDRDSKKITGKVLVHWILTDIPPDTIELEEFKSGINRIGTSGRNSIGTKNYYGMCPIYRTHNYNIKAYVLDLKILKSLREITQKKFEKKYQGNIISSYLIIGTSK